MALRDLDSTVFEGDFDEPDIATSQDSNIDQESTCASTSANEEGSDVTK